MAIEHPPDPRVGDFTTLIRYRPRRDQVARYHTVKPGKDETLQTVARENGFSEAELVAFNFPGSVVRGNVVPPIVNWYLHHHIEFHCPDTEDQKNRRFKGNERLAIPIRTTVIEFDEPTVIEGRVRDVPGLWFGGGYKGGATFGVVGIETAQIACISADGKHFFTATISGTRFPAIGVGASGGPIVMLITSMKSPYQLSNLLAGGKDYSLAIGTKLESVIGTARYAKAVKALADFAEKYGRAGKSGVKAGTALAKYNGQISDIAKMLDMKLNAPEPQVFSFGSPWGGFGLEASYHFTVSKFFVESVTDT
jgi:hypothetical protein